MVQDVSCDASQPRGHVQDARLGRRIQAGAHLELATDCTLPVLVQLAIRAVEDGSIGVGLVKSHTSRERLAKAGHQGRGRQAGVAGRQHRALAALRWGRMFVKRWRFGVFIGFGGRRVRGSARRKELISVRSWMRTWATARSLKLGHSCLKGEDLVFCCCQLRFAGGAQGFEGIFLKLVFRWVEGVRVIGRLLFGGVHVGQGVS